MVTAQRRQGWTDGRACNSRADCSWIYIFLVHALSRHIDNLRLPLPATCCFRKLRERYQVCLISPSVQGSWKHAHHREGTIVQICWVKCRSQWPSSGLLAWMFTIVATIWEGRQLYLLLLRSTWGQLGNGNMPHWRLHQVSSNRTSRMAGQYRSDGIPTRGELNLTLNK